MITKSLGLIGLSHPHVTRDGSLIYDFRVPMAVCTVES
jgi:hypothetical protein